MRGEAPNAKENIFIKISVSLYITNRTEPNQNKPWRLTSPPIFKKKSNKMARAMYVPNKRTTASEHFCFRLGKTIWLENVFSFVFCSELNEFETFWGKAWINCNENTAFGVVCAWTIPLWKFMYARMREWDGKMCRCMRPSVRPIIDANFNHLDEWLKSRIYSPPFLLCLSLNFNLQLVWMAFKCAEIDFQVNSQIRSRNFGKNMLDSLQKSNGMDWRWNFH